MILDLATASSTAGIVTAVSVVTGLIVGISGLIVAVTQLLSIKKSNHEIHVMVNQQRTDAQRYQIALVNALRAHGIDVPVDQSLPTETDE